jgi:hypothetical protein
LTVLKARRNHQFRLEWRKPKETRHMHAVRMGPLATAINCAIATPALAQVTR